MKNEKDLFDEIGAVLHAHEDAYVPGAWEEFAKTRKRKRGIIFLRLAAAASVILFIGYAAWLFTPSAKVDTKPDQAKNTTKPPYIYPNSKHDSLVAKQSVVPQKSANGSSTTTLPLAATPQRAITKEFLAPKNIAEPKREVNKGNGFTNPSDDVNIAGLVKTKTDSNAIANTVPPAKNTVEQPTVINNAPIANAEPRRYDRGTQRLSYDSIANLNKPKPLPAEEKKSKNLSYALMVSPSVGNQKMNFGTGVEVAYNINKSFSVSSGIAYAYVNAGAGRSPMLDASYNRGLQGYNAAPSSANNNSLSYTSGTSSQTVQSVKLALSGVEIPLSFQYKTKSGFFISTGVSAMSVIGNDLSYNYINNYATSAPSANGLSTISVVSENITQKSSEKISGYVGFYTLSAGKKISFGKGKLNFAPFIKIPFSGVSSENIQLMHGGVQLGFGF